MRKAKPTLEGCVIGLLRSHNNAGSVQEGPGVAAAAFGPEVLLTLSLPQHAVCCGENLSINDREGPVAVPVAAGQITLHQAFALTASHPHSVKPCKAPSARVVPHPARDPLWICYWEPFSAPPLKGL